MLIINFYDPIERRMRSASFSSIERFRVYCDFLIEHSLPFTVSYDTKETKKGVR